MCPSWYEDFFTFVATIGVLFHLFVGGLNTCAKIPESRTNLARRIIPFLHMTHWKIGCSPDIKGNIQIYRYNSFRIIIFLYMTQWNIGCSPYIKGNIQKYRYNSFRIIIFLYMTHWNIGCSPYIKVTYRYIGIIHLELLYSHTWHTGILAVVLI